MGLNARSLQVHIWKRRQYIRQCIDYFDQVWAEEMSEQEFRTTVIYSVDEIRHRRTNLPSIVTTERCRVVSSS